MRLIRCCYCYEQRHDRYLLLVRVLYMYAAGVALVPAPRKRQYPIQAGYKHSQQLLVQERVRDEASQCPRYTYPRPSRRKILERHPLLHLPSLNQSNHTPRSLTDALANPIPASFPLPRAASRGLEGIVHRIQRLVSFCPGGKPRTCARSNIQLAAARTIPA